MKKIYQDREDNCMQAALASLLDMELEEVPNFQEYGDAWSKFMSFISLHEYVFNGCLYNPKLAGSDLDSRFGHLFGMKGVNGYFLALVESPNSGIANHVVVIDKSINIVNPVKEEYEGVKFPKTDEIGYHGIKQILLIHKKKESGNV